MTLGEGEGEARSLGRSIELCAHLTSFYNCRLLRAQWPEPADDIISSTFASGAAEPKRGSFSQISHGISGVQFIGDSTPFLYPSVHSVVTPESSQCFNSRHALSGMPPLRIVHCVSLRAFYFSLQSHLEGVGGGDRRTRLGAIKALI